MVPKDKTADQKEKRASPSPECIYADISGGDITVSEISVRAKVCAVMGISNGGGGSERAM